MNFGQILKANFCLNEILSVSKFKVNVRFIIFCGRILIYLDELIIFERKLFKTLVGVAGGNEYSINGIVESLQFRGDLNILIL